MDSKGIIGIHLLISTLFLMPFSSMAIIRMGTEDKIYERVEDVPEKELALILGAAAYPNRLSDMLRHRMDVGVSLYESGKVNKIVVSGAPHESLAMKQYAMEKGIPEEDILEDPEGLNTLNSVEYLASLTDSAVLVSQKYHLPRAVFMARAKGIEAAGMAADTGEYIKLFDYQKRELLAISKAVYDAFVSVH